MKTWYEKFYGEPAPVKDKLKAERERLQAHVEFARRNGWTMEKAKDYIKKLREKPIE